MAEDENPGGRSLEGMTTLDQWLDEEGIREDVGLAAFKKVIAVQLLARMEETRMSKTELARLMKTSRTQVDRVLDPDKDVNIGTLAKAAEIMGRRVRLELI